MLGHSEMITLTLSLGARVSSDDLNGLNSAASVGGLETVMQLLSTSAVNRDCVGRALVSAAYRSKLFSKRVLANNFSGKELETMGRIVRHAWEMREAIMDALLGANPPLASVDQALINAADAGDLPVVEMLLAAGANVNVDFGMALTVAAREGHLDIVRVLIGTAPPPGNLIEALNAAAKGGYATIAGVLLDAGANVNQDSGFALSTAAWYGHVDVVATFLAAQPMERTISNALKMAVKHEQVNVIPLLLDAVDSVRHSIFIAAAEIGNVDVVEMITAGAEIHAYQDEALHIAATKGHHAVVMALLKAGWDNDVYKEEEEAMAEGVAR